jgi:hypothetical protein
VFRAIALALCVVSLTAVLGSEAGSAQNENYAPGSPYMESELWFNSLMHLCSGPLMQITLALTG